MESGGTLEITGLFQMVIYGKLETVGCQEKQTVKAACHLKGVPFPQPSLIA